MIPIRSVTFGFSGSEYDNVLHFSATYTKVYDPKSKEFVSLEQAQIENQYINGAADKIILTTSVTIHFEEDEDDLEPWQRPEPPANPGDKRATVTIDLGKVAWVRTIYEEEP